MGYTHYWHRPVGKDFEAEKWKTFVNEVKILSKALPSDIKLGDGLGEKPFKLEKDRIWFNGIGDESHETFGIERVCPPQVDYRRGESELFSFCKTARKPYDLMVTACLLRLKYYFPYTRVTSDGHYKDWEPAREFIKKVLGENMNGIARGITK